MVYKWSMAMQFSFEYYKDPKDHKFEEEIKAIAVEGAMRPIEVGVITPTFKKNLLFKLPTLVKSIELAMLNFSI